jgi:hypothetical protein
MGSWKVGSMKTTLEIPDELFRAAKAKAALEGIKLKELVARGLEREVRGMTTAGGGLAASSLRGLELHAPRQRTQFPLLKPGKRPFPYLTNALIQEVLADEDAEHYGRFLRR